MLFTYEAYRKMLIKLKDKGYEFTDYKSWNKLQKTVILRHDVDYNLEKAAKISELESDIGDYATYFVLLSTNFYNVNSRESRKSIDEIVNNGGLIGLHFDETQYNIDSEEELKECVYKEMDMLSKIIGINVDVVSMHRPSDKFLKLNLAFDGIINSYDKIYFKNMKYLSDSRRHWRENVDEIVEKGMYQRLHVLTHPFWYRQGAEADLKQTLKEAIMNSMLQYYDNINNNFRNFADEIERAEIERMISKCDTH